MFWILFADFANFCHFFTLFVNLPLAISCIYLDAPGKGSPCILRRFSGGPRSFDIFYQILPILVLFCIFVMNFPWILTFRGVPPASV